MKEINCKLLVIGAGQTQGNQRGSVFELVTEALGELDQRAREALFGRRAEERDALVRHRGAAAQFAGQHERCGAVRFERGDELEDGTTLIPLRLTRAELAALVGTTVETTIRTLSRWSREGLVSTIDGGLTVHDPVALARRSAANVSYMNGTSSAAALS